MKTIKDIGLAFLLTGFFLQAAAQNQKPLSLEEAIRLGVENSNSVKLDRAKMQEAQANLIAAKNNRLPEFKISGSALALANAKVDLKIAQGGAGGNTPKANSAFFGNANFSLPIFSGGRIKYGIQSAEYLVKAAELSQENDELAIAYNIAQAYNNLYKSGQVVGVLKQNLSTSQARDKNFLNLENNGVLARNDRLKANLQTSNTELQLLEAESNRTLANINMNLLLGLPEDTELIPDPAYANGEFLLNDVKSYVDQAYQNRKDLQVLDYQKKAAENSVKSAKAENLPSIAATAGYIAAEVPKILSVYNAANIGLGIQYNLSNFWKKNSSLLNAEAQIKKIEANQDIIHDQIKLDINRDYQNYLLAQKKIDLFERTYEQAKENYRITKNKYDNGLETITNLLEADTAQISANVNVLNAKADAALAYKKLLLTAGHSIND